jgi:glycosyltransferase involved in cell wall biosynthesis
VSTLPVSAVVVSRNEGHLLSRCLESIRFCDELIVVDLESEDDTAEIARRLGARVIHHPVARVVEAVRRDVAAEATHPWLLMVDPDEVVDPALADELEAGFAALPATTAIVSAPCQFYFRGTPLRGTVWGGLTERPTLAHRGRVDFSPDVHHGISPKPGFELRVLAPSGSNVIHHYWMVDYAGWLRKHMRYVKEERLARKRHGVRVNVLTLLLVVPGRFVESFVVRRGYLDGVRGFLLSVGWAAYHLAAVSTSLSLQAPLRLRKLGGL